ncbi:MAG: DUF4280 domain-containing protein [Desulfobacteraceae bacterium]|nr:DUF4280 domain-containing protein [Desulfobacteraceae bacterium]
MAMQVCMGAMLQCSFGVTPSALVVTPENMVSTMTPDANIMDHVPGKNILPFGMCSAPSNPTVAAATTAALGVLTPMPCIPATTSPWVPGSPTVHIANQSALNDTSTLMCTWGGVISITFPGQTTVQIP